jgi:DNA repair exonuclease SbcCD ATPase subunit
MPKDDALPTQVVVTQPVVEPQALTTQTKPDPAEETPVEEWDKDRAAKTIKTQREEAKALKERIKKLEVLEAEEAKRKEAEMSELQKAEQRAANAEAEAAKLRLEGLRSKVALAAGLPAAFADRLQGATEDEMSEDAKKLLEAMPVKPTLKPKIDNPGSSSKVETLDDLKKQRDSRVNDPWNLLAAKTHGGGVVIPEKE